MTPSSTGSRAGPASRSTVLYKAQRAYVATMLDVLSRLIVAGSISDPVIKRELEGFPEGLTVGFSVLGDSLSMRVAYRDKRLVRVSERTGHADVEVVFKHIAHAFLLLSFQESTPVAFANDRMVTHGDIGLTMRFVRCLDRVQAVMLPDPIAARALKSLPNIPGGQRLLLVTRITGRLLQTFVTRATP